MKLKRTAWTTGLAGASGYEMTLLARGGRKKTAWAYTVLLLWQSQEGR